jgi:hypothetical protein
MFYDSALPCTISLSLSHQSALKIRPDHLGFLRRNIACSGPLCIKAVPFQDGSAITSCTIKNSLAPKTFSDIIPQEHS